MRGELRGERQLQAAFYQALKAAARNSDKGDWRRWSRWRLLIKLFEEVIEFCFAVLWGDPQRKREELGDVVWSAVMIADHDMALELEKVANYHLGEE